MRRRRFLACLASLPVPFFSACESAPPLTVCVHPWIGYETLVLAREFNWLPAEVRLHDVSDASGSLAALRAGQVDAACLTLDEALRARAFGLPLSVALVFDVSTGGDVVLARPSIHSLAGLAGKRVGLERGTVAALVLDKLQEVAGIPAAALALVDLPPNRQLAAWRSGAVDAVVTYEPTATRLVREGARRLFDSRQMPDAIFDVLAVRADRAFGRSAALEALLAAHFRALEHLRVNREDAVYRVAAHQGITPDEVRQVLAGVALPSLPANRAYLAAHDIRLSQAARMLCALMVRHGLLPREDSLAGLVRPDWLPREG
jgi:NitT/TauT family transport system substrate-binding protein